MDLPGLRSTNSTLSLSYESPATAAKDLICPQDRYLKMRSSFWTPTSSQGSVHRRTKLRFRNTVYFFHRVYSAQISACVIVPAADARMFVAERRNSHRQCGFGNPAQPSAGRNPQTVLAPRMRRYLADRQWRSFLRIPSGAMHSRVVRLEPVGIQSGGFQFQELSFSRKRETAEPLISKE